MKHFTIVYYFAGETYEYVVPLNKIEMVSSKITRAGAVHIEIKLQTCIVKILTQEIQLTPLREALAGWVNIWKMGGYDRVNIVNF